MYISYYPRKNADIVAEPITDPPNRLARPGKWTYVSKYIIISNELSLEPRSFPNIKKN